MLQLAPLDLGLNELRRAVIQNLAAAPGTPLKGQIYFDTVLNQFGYYNGTSWVYSTTAPDATTGVKGLVQLTNHLAGTATAPTVVNFTLSGDANANSHKITGLSTPTVRTDGASKGYSDDTIYAHPVRAATTTNTSLASPGATLDGVTLATGDRVLLMAQTTSSQNGPWVWNGAAVAMSRPADWASGSTRILGEMFLVAPGGASFGDELIRNGSWTVSFVVDTGNPSFGTTQAFPTGAAGGDLAGTYPNPTVAASAITLAKIAGAVTLDAIAAGHATAGDVNVNTHKLINVTDPTGAQDAATKNYVDTTVQGLSPKSAARVATVGSETYTIAAGAVTQITGTSVDGIAPAIGDMILIRNAPASTGAGTGSSTTSSSNPANGLYVVTGNTTNLTVSRASDASTWAELSGALVPIMAGGTVQGDTIWLSTTQPGGTLNTTAVSFTLFQNATSVVGDNTYISRTGNVLGPVALTTPTAPGAGSVSAASLALTRTAKFALKGDGTTTAFTLTHSFGSSMVSLHAQQDNTGVPGAPVVLDWAPGTSNTVVITFPTAPTSGTVFWVNVFV